MARTKKKKLVGAPKKLLAAMHVRRPAPPRQLHRRSPAQRQASALMSERNIPFSEVLIDQSHHHCASAYIHSDAAYDCRILTPGIKVLTPGIEVSQHRRQRLLLDYQMSLACSSSCEIGGLG